MLFCVAFNTVELSYASNINTPVYSRFCYYYKVLFKEVLGLWFDQTQKFSFDEIEFDASLKVNLNKEDSN